MMSMLDIIKNIHIGKEIETFVKKKMNVTTFAELVPCSRTKAYNIFRSKSIEIDLLVRISKILDYDFIENVYLIPIYGPLKPKEDDNKEIQKITTLDGEKYLIIGKSNNIFIIQKLDDNKTKGKLGN